MPAELTFEDITGRTVSRGDRIAYPVRQRSNMWLATARVERIVKGTDGDGAETLTIYARNPTSRQVVIKAIERVVKLPEGTPR